MKPEPVELRSRSTWIRADGATVHIAGPTHPRGDVWWSIQGDWYRRDGRYFDSGKPDWSPEHRRLVREDKSASARAWWNGVRTDRRGACS